MNLNVLNIQIIFFKTIIMYLLPIKFNNIIIIYNYCFQYLFKMYTNYLNKI